MKAIICAVMLFISAPTFASALTYSEVKNFVNSETVVAINILNRVLTKLNITSCSQISSSRPDDYTTIRVDYTEVGLYSEYNTYGPSGTNIWDGVIPDYNIQISYEDPSSTGMERRIKLYAQNGYVDTSISSDVGMIYEFTCDMKKVHFFQTGSDNATTADMMEVYWSNTDPSAPVVNFKYAGPVKNTAVTYIRDVSAGTMSTQVTNDYNSISNLLTEFGITTWTMSAFLTSIGL